MLWTLLLVMLEHMPDFLKKFICAIEFKNERVGPTCQVGKDTPICLKYSVGKGTAAMHVVD